MSVLVREIALQCVFHHLNIHLFIGDTNQVLVGIHAVAFSDPQVLMPTVRFSHPFLSLTTTAAMTGRDTVNTSKYINFLISKPS